MAWGLSKTGFNRPNQAQLKEEIDQRQKELFGENVNLSSKSPNGILSGILSWAFSIVWQVLERVYKNGHVSEAEGVSLDYKTIEFNTSRNPEQYAEGTLTITGTPNHTILAGTRFEKENGTDYALKENTTLDSVGNGVGEIVSLSPGIVGNAFVGEITVQSEPSADILTVTNEEDVTGGREKETDDELRSRLLKLGASNGSGTPNAILADVLAVVGVRAANITVNNKDVEVNGQPPHSNHVYALGGDGQAIAEALFKNYVGLQFFGSDEYTVKDSGGNTHIIAYTQASAVDIYVNVTLTTNSSFQASGVNQVKDAIVKLIGGLATDGTMYSGLSMGEDVIRWQIETAIGKNVPGVTDVLVTLGTSIDPTETENIPIAAAEVAQISSSDITVIL